MQIKSNKIAMSGLGLLMMFSLIMPFGVVLAEGGFDNNTGIKNIINDTGTTKPVNDDAYATPGTNSGSGSSSSGNTGGNSWVNVFTNGSGGTSYGSGGSYENGSFANPNFTGSGTSNSGVTTIDFAPAKVNLPSATCTKITDVGSLFRFVTCTVVNSIIPLIIVLSITVFMWGTVMFMMNTADTAKRKEGKQFMIWGIIALFVIVSYWGIVRLFSDTLGFTGIKPPQLQQGIYPQL